MSISEATLNKFKNLLGQNCWSDNPSIIEPHLKEWRDKFNGQTELVFFPRSTLDVQKIVCLANDTKTKIAVQGGNTGLVGGNTPGLEGRDEILVSLTKMNKITPPNTIDQTIVVEAGCILENVQKAASDNDLSFPLSLASQGSCTIGGNISTNAGGIHVIQHGTMKDLTIGVEAVLANGQIWNGLSNLKKDNTGFDLNRLLMGSEGTLGIITKAILKLTPRPLQTVTGWVSVSSADDALALLTTFQREFGPQLAAFELMHKDGLQFVYDHIPDMGPPTGSNTIWHILFDVNSSSQDSTIANKAEDLMGRVLESGIVKDGTLAMSESQAAQLWRIRESMSEAQKYEGSSIKHDISVPVSAVPDFLKAAIPAVLTIAPNSRPTPFGHMGDGNIHFNIMQPADMRKEDFLALWPIMSERVHDIVKSFDGSISAEHGIGTLKREELRRVTTDDKIEIMRSIKSALDPNSILNVGRIF